MRSVVVVFPASMWAMMPMLRILSSGVALAIASSVQQKCGATGSPANGPVSLLCHPVRVFLLLDRLAFALRGEDHFGGQPLGHRLLASRPAVLDEPPHAEGR